MSVKPITPQKAQEAKAHSIPEYVIAAVNELLVKKIHPTSKTPSITLLQKDVIKAVIEKAKEGGLQVTSGYLFDEHYLDFEALFAQYGWKVVYDRPAYCENYEASWAFSAS